jgi:hypothetical protein
LTSQRQLKRGVNLAADLALFLERLCADNGYCNRLTVEDLLKDSPTLSAEAFASAVLTAEGLSVEYNSEQRRYLKRLFVERYGGANISDGTYWI